MIRENSGGNSPLYYDRNGVAAGFPAESWQRVSFEAFSERIDSRTRVFPCHFGTAGFRQDQLRYHFSDDGDPEVIAAALGAYIESCRSFGQNTSFVVTVKTNEIESVADYHQKFWNLLQSIRSYDTEAWPESIPMEVDRSEWEFCFAGEPLFVVCTTPAHQQRQSRFSEHFSLLFQPRWVFATILDTEKKAEKAFNSVRELLRDYDQIALSPYLGMYGNPANREHLQYFLSDDQSALGCPFSSVGERESQVAVASR